MLLAVRTSSARPAASAMAAVCSPVRAASGVQFARSAPVQASAGIGSVPRFLRTTTPAGFAASHSDSTMSAMTRLAELSGLMLASRRNRIMIRSSQLTVPRMGATTLV